MVSVIMEWFQTGGCDGGSSLENVANRRACAQPYFRNERGPLSRVVAQCFQLAVSQTFRLRVAPKRRFGATAASRQGVRTARRLLVRPTLPTFSTPRRLEALRYSRLEARATVGATDNSELRPLISAESHIDSPGHLRQHSAVSLKNIGVGVRKTDCR